MFSLASKKGYSIVSQGYDILHLITLSVSMPSMSLSIMVRLSILNTDVIACHIILA